MLGECMLAQDASASPASSELSAPVVEGGDVSPSVEGPKVGRPGSLVLTRYLGESIMIGDNVEIQLIMASGGKARLRVVAPREVSVHRREVFDALRSGVEPASSRG